MRGNETRFETPDVGNAAKPRFALRGALLRRLCFLLSAGVMALASLMAAPIAQAQSPTPATKAADPAAGEQLYTAGDPTRNIVACVSCHGAAGNSAAPTNPKLAGQFDSYLYKQLHDFKPAAGQAKPARLAPVMNAYATPLTDADMQNIAAYLSRQTLKPAIARKDETIALGEKIYRGGIAAKQVPACAGCHGPNGAGIPAQFPRLGGQFADYTRSQLVAFRAGTRQNSTQMSAIAARLSDAEMLAVSNYIAGLR